MSKSSNRVVLGRWVESGGYIEEAKTNGGIWFETDPSFFSKLSSGLNDGLAREKAWSVNEQFLKSNLEQGVERIDLAGESIREVLINRPNSFTALEIKYLDSHADTYGYIRNGNSWIKGD